MRRGLAWANKFAPPRRKIDGKFQSIQKRTHIPTPSPGRYPARTRLRDSKMLLHVFRFRVSLPRKRWKLLANLKKLRNIFPAEGVSALEKNVFRAKIRELRPSGMRREIRTNKFGRARQKIDGKFQSIWKLTSTPRTERVSTVHEHGCRS